jgi:hypothetical protein
MIADEYLDLSLRSVVALASRPHPRDTPIAVKTIVDAVRKLERRIAAQDAADEASDREWLAALFERTPVG